MILAAVALMLLGYAGFQWFSQRTAVEEASIEPRNPHVIPLAIPPNRSTEAASVTETPARPGQSTPPEPNPGEN
jgi:hypothetical protein